MRYEIGAVNDTSEQQHRIIEPLFEGPIDFDQQGGLVVLETGQIAEVTALAYIPRGGDTSLEGSRVKPQPFWKTPGGVVWRGPEYDPKSPTIGVELELPTMSKQGEWHKLSVDGNQLTYPDGTTEPGVNQGHVRESLSYAHECGSEKPYPAGYEDFRDQTEELKARKIAWLDSHQLVSPPISGFPEAITPDDTTEHPITEMLERPDVLPRFLEYAYSFSEQLNIQFRDVESALFAINTYQGMQPVLNLVTASSAIRDGSIDTTLRDHYEENPGFDRSPTAEHYRERAEQIKMEAPKKVDPDTGEVDDFYDHKPYDWRPIARANGSRSGGIITQGAPVTLEEFLREGDRQLRSGETMTIARTLGWHTDRLRPDKGVIEVCNISHGGHHPDKMPAAEESAIKVIIGLQEYYSDPHTYKHEWAGIIPHPGVLDDPETRQAHVDTAHVNNNVVAFYGKQRGVYDTTGQERTLEEVYGVFADFADTYAPEPISQEAQTEIRATLQEPTPSGEFSSAQQVFDYFYSQGSNMTAVEAIRAAGEVEADTEVNQLLLTMTAASKLAQAQRREKRFAELAMGEIAA